MEIIRILVPTGAQAKQYDIITRAVSDRSSIESLVDIYDNKFITEPRAGDILSNLGRSIDFNVQSKSSREMYKYVIAEKHKILTTSRKEENISLYAINKYDTVRLEDLVEVCKEIDFETIESVHYRRIPVALNVGTIVSTTGNYSSVYKDRELRNLISEDEVYIACDDTHTENSVYTEYVGEDVVSFIPLKEDGSTQILQGRGLVEKVSKSQYDVKIITEEHLGRYCRCFKTEMNKSLYTKIDHLLTNSSTRDLGVKLFYKFDLEHVEEFDFKSMFYLSMLYNKHAHSISYYQNRSGNGYHKVKDLSAEFFNSAISFELFLTDKLETILGEEELVTIRKEFLSTFEDQGKWAAERYLPNVNRDEYTVEADITSGEITLKIKFSETNGDKTTEFLQRFTKDDERTREIRPENVVEQVEY